jgi:acyl-CoA thioesterase
MPNNDNPFADDNFAKHLGIELITASRGTATAKMQIRDHHHNGTGTAHGGAIFSLAIWTAAIAANQNQPQLSVGLNADITYLRPISSGTLTATAQISADTKKIATYNVTITDHNNQTIATLKALTYKKTANATVNIE